jgi:hypothetical protein
MFGKAVIIVVGLTVLGFIFSSLRRTSDPAVNAVQMIAGNGETATEARGSSVLRGSIGETREGKMNDVLCRWSGLDVVVTALITSTSPQRVTIRWQPYYELQGETRRFGVDDPTLEQVRKLAPRQAITIEARERPIGVPKGTGITSCGAAFYTTPA